MANSFQKEIPKARVNITLDLETYGAKKKMELPLKMLVLGDYSNGQTEGPVKERDKININKENFESVLNDMSPALKLSVPNKIANDDSDIAVNLTFDSSKSFNPDKVAEQIPELQSMMAMRNLLKDLKSNLLDNTKFRKELENIVKNQPELENLQKQLEQIIPSDSDNATD
ncbi:Uncharacterized protein ImpB [hydrothermal vent metagenome]|uniref:Uncharacterized protein ImpB n=1 Tax=hydrothermal vent metagenome TaxID=652676 RepID=A0A3B0YHH0_9ZZZZ